MLTPEQISERLKWLLGHVESHLLTLSVALQVVYKVRVMLLVALCLTRCRLRRMDRRSLMKTVLSKR